MCKSEKFCNACVVTIEALTSAQTININSSSIQGKTILGFSMRRGTGKTRMGKTLAAQAVIDTAHLSIKENAQMRLDPLPLSNIQRDYNDPEPYCFNLKNLDSSSIEIKLDTTTLGYDSTHAIEITFYLDCCS